MIYLLEVRRASTTALDTAEVAAVVANSETLAEVHLAGQSG